MAFTVKDWKNEPDLSTPMSAEALEDSEARLSAYTDAQITTLGNTRVPKTFVEVHIQDHGAVAGQDSRVAINAAITAANAAATAIGGGAVGVVRGTPGASYRLTDGVSVLLSSNVRLRGIQFDLSNWTGPGAAVTAQGTLGSNVTLTANAVEGATTLTAAVWTGIVAGDWVKVSADNVFGATNQPVGEFARVLSVAGTTLNLATKLRDSYTTANNAKAQKANFLSNVGLQEVGVLGPGNTALSISGASLTLCKNLVVDDCLFERTHREGLGLTDVIDSTLTRVHAERNEMTGLAYGIGVYWACENVLISKLIGRRMRHAVTMGGGTGYSGVPRNILVESSFAMEMTDAGFDCHAIGEQINFNNCHVDGSTQDGFAFLGASGSINNCTVRNVTRYGILYRPSTNRPHEFEAKNVKIYNTGNRAISIEPQAGFENWRRLELDVYIDTVNSIGIELNNTQTTRYENVTISYSAREINAGSALRLVKCGRIKLIPKNVYMKSNSSYGAIFENCANGEVAGGIFGVTGVPTSTRAVGLFTGCDRIDVHDIRLIDGEYGVWLDDTTVNSRVHDNDLTGATSEAIHPGTGTTNIFHHNKPGGEGSTQTVATDAAFTLTPHTSPEHTLHTGTLTAGRAVTLSTTNAYQGQKFKVSRSGGGAFNLTVGAKALATNQWSEHTFIGVAWVLTSFGSL